MVCNLVAVLHIPGVLFAVHHGLMGLTSWAAGARERIACCRRYGDRVKPRR